MLSLNRIHFAAPLPCSKTKYKFMSAQLNSFLQTFSSTTPVGSSTGKLSNDSSCGHHGNRRIDRSRGSSTSGWKSLVASSMAILVEMYQLIEAI